jgi:hypothetical protein
MVWVRERTIPTERPPLVGEMIANFCGYKVSRGQRDGQKKYSKIKIKMTAFSIVACSHSSNNKEYYFMECNTL